MRKALLSTAIAAMTMTFVSPVVADQAPRDNAPTQMKRMSAPHDDPTFAMHMAQHHRDGIAMADAVIANGKSDSVKAMARRSRSDQQKDLAKLEHHRGDKAHESAQAAMPPKDPEMERGMARLKAAKGAEADRLFLELMIAHHASGLMMAHTAMPELGDTELKSMAQNMFTKQAREIGELQRLREGTRAARTKPL